MIIDNLKARCVDSVAWEIARERLPKDHNKDNPETRSLRWSTLAREAHPEAAEKINNMTNMELLDLISEILVND